MPDQVTPPVAENARRICLIDFRLSGHHTFYLANFASAFMRLGCEVHVFTSDTSKCKEMMSLSLPELETDLLSFFETVSSPVNGKRRWGCRAYFNLTSLQSEIEVYEALKKIEFDLVFFAYLDDVSHKEFFLPYLFRSPFTKKFSGLLMSPRDKILRTVRAPFNKLATTFIEQSDISCKEIGLLVEDVGDQVEARTGRSIVVYPDFCSSVPLERVSDPLCETVAIRSAGRKITSLLGSIQPHKSIDLLHKCLQTADSSEHFFVVAGYFHRTHFSSSDWTSIESLMQNPPENLLIHNGWLESESVFDSLIQQSSFLFAFYRDFRKSSNILTKGAFYKKPVIVSDQYLMGARVKKYHLGFARTEQEVPALYEGDTLANFRFDNVKRERFVALNSVNRLDSIFQRLLA